MADQYLQSAENTGTSTVAVTLNGVAAGSALVAFLFDGSSGNVPTSVSDGTSYTAGNSANDTINFVYGKVFYRENVAAGNYTITGTITAGASGYMCVAEVGSSGAGAVAGTAAQTQSNPGTGANAVTSGSATVSGASTLAAFSADSASTATSDEPSAGTGFTTRLNNANATIGAYRLESKATSASAAGTFTAVTGTHQFVTLAAAVTNSAAGGTSNVLESWQQQGAMGVRITI